MQSAAQVTRALQRMVLRSRGSGKPLGGQMRRKPASLAYRVEVIRKSAEQVAALGFVTGQALLAGADRAEDA